jgi:hypothetical protein
VTGDSSSQDLDPPLRAPRRRTSNTRTTGPQSSSSLSLPPDTCNGGAKGCMCGFARDLPHAACGTLFCVPFRKQKQGLASGLRWLPMSPGVLSSLCAGRLPQKKIQDAAIVSQAAPHPYLIPGNPVLKKPLGFRARQTPRFIIITPPSCLLRRGFGRFLSFCHHRKPSSCPGPWSAARTSELCFSVRIIQPTP